MMKKSAYITYKKIFKEKNLNELYEKTIHLNTASGIDGMVKKVFDKNPNLHFSIIDKKIYNGTYNFTPYKEKLFIKNRNSLPRMISIPTIRDKIVHKGLHIIMREAFLINQPLVQSVISDMKKDLEKFDSYIKIDIEKFYDNINHDVLLKKLSKKIRHVPLQDLILKAIKTPTTAYGYSSNNGIESNDLGVPQGLSISNTLAEIFFIDVDRKFKKMKTISYFRYVDDILILCNRKKLESIKKKIVDELETDYLLRINEQKCSSGNINEEGFDFLGYRVQKIDSNENVGLTIKRNTKNKFEKSIVDMFTRYRDSEKVTIEEFVFHLNNKITGSISSKVNGDTEKEKKYGWVFFFSQVDDLNVFRHLDWFIKKMLVNFNLNNQVSDKGLEVKSFMKTYYEIIYNRTKTKYIHRPDRLTIEEKKNLLIHTFNFRRNYLDTDEKIERNYYSRVYKPIKRLEKDVQNLS